MLNFPALGALHSDPHASGGWGLCPQTPTFQRLGASPPDPQNSPPLQIPDYASAFAAYYTLMYFTYYTFFKI